MRHSVMNGVKCNNQEHAIFFNKKNITDESSWEPMLATTGVEASGGGEQRRIFRNLRIGEEIRNRVVNRDWGNSRSVDERV